MFIMNPMAGLRGNGRVSNLFSTHPPTAQRIARLEAISARINGTPPARPDAQQFREL